MRTLSSQQSPGTQKRAQIVCDLVFCVFFAWLDLTHMLTLMDGCATSIVDGDLNTEIFGLTLMKAMSLDEGRTLLASQEIPTLLDLILCNMEFKGRYQSTSEGLDNGCQVVTKTPRGKTNANKLFFCFQPSFLVHHRQSLQDY